MAKLAIAKTMAAATPAAMALKAEAELAFPALAQPGDPLFPRTKGVGRCRLCGRQRLLTREHVPPRTAFNLETGRMHSVLDWLARTAEGILPGGLIQQGGNWGYTLCAECNSFTGTEYAHEYGRMAGGIVNTFVGENVNELDAQAEQPVARFKLTGAAAGLAPRPGTFVREALAMMCTMSANLDLAGTAPAIRRIVRDKSVEPLPVGMSVGLTAYFHKDSRLVGPTIEVLLAENQWRVVMEVAHRPLAVLMVLGGTAANPHVCDISAWTQIAADAQQNVEGRIAIGFGHTPMPGDYRTHAMVEAQA